METARSFDKRLFFAYVICGLAAIFYLPLLFPQPASTSVSYAFGYNNRVGVILVLVLVSIGAAWTKGLDLQLRAAGGSDAVPVKTLLASLLGVLAGCVGMYLFAGRFGGFGESSYFIDRAWLLSQGKVPYVDFEWAYGVYFLYLPVFLQRLLHLDVVHAYYLFWIFNCLLGTVLLFATINMVDYPTGRKRSVFLLLYGATATSILCMGANYTNLRYISPLFFLLAVDRVLKGDSARARVFAAISAVAFTIVLLLISPEIAIAHAFACVFIFVAGGASRGRSFGAVAGLLLSFAMVFGVALRLHVLDSIVVNGKGADSFPIAVSPHLLLFFAAIFVCACYLVRRLWWQPLHDNSVGLIAYSLPMTAAALGRCDPGHVLFNGAGVFLASMFYVSNYKDVWKWYKAAFVVFMILLPTFAGTVIYLPYIARIVMHPRNETVNLSSLYPSWQGTFLVPFGYRPNGIGAYLSPRIDYGHYEGFENANTVAAIDTKLAEMKDHPDEALLLPSYFPLYCEVNVAADRRVMGLLFAFPYYGKAVHLEGIRQPVCDYIQARYEMKEGPTPQNFAYGLWTARPAETSLGTQGPRRGF